MPILNETLVFNQLPGSIHDTFVSKAARRILLPEGTELYKFTGFGVVPTRSGSNYSPWWGTVEPTADTTDPGLDGHIAAARTAGLPMLQYARERFAVMLGWNPLGDPGTGIAKVERIRLRQEVYGFGGLCQRMRETVPPHRVIGRVNVNKSPLNPPIFLGGAYQYYIPNLTAAYVLPCGTNLIP